MLKLLLLGILLYIAFHVLCFFWDLIAEYVLPLIGIVVAVAVIGVVVYFFIRAEWAAADGFFDFAGAIGQVVLFLGGIGLLIWSLFSQTGRNVLLIVSSIAAVIGSVWISVYVYTNFGGIYGIISFLILGGLAFWLLATKAGQAFVNMLANRSISKSHYTSDVGESCITCSNCHFCKINPSAASDGSFTCQYYNDPQAYELWMNDQ